MLICLLVAGSDPDLARFPALVSPPSPPHRPTMASPVLALVRITRLNSCPDYLDQVASGAVQVDLLGRGYLDSLRQG